MDDYESLSYSNWECKYHVVFIPKCRRKTLRREEANFVGQHFWASGYFVSTVPRDTEVIREYIKKQEEEEERLEQMNLWR